MGGVGVVDLPSGHDPVEGDVDAEARPKYLIHVLDDLSYVRVRSDDLLRIRAAQMDTETKGAGGMRFRGAAGGHRRRGQDHAAEDRARKRQEQPPEPPPARV